LGEDSVVVELMPDGKVFTFLSAKKETIQPFEGWIVFVFKQI